VQPLTLQPGEMVASPRRAPAVQNPRRDPAPSRTAYRLHRLWLTPLFRALLRVGLPAFLTVFCLGMYFADETRRDALASGIEGLRDRIEERPEFMVTEMLVEGASAEVANALLAMAPVKLPVSSFDLDLVAVKAKLEEFDAVARAEVQIRSGGVLVMTVAQRKPALVWRARTALHLIDETGHRVASIAERDARADLPLIAGDGADKAVPEALQLLKAAGPLGPRVRGLVRMGERRWDLVLDRGQRILLPAENPVQALERVIALDQAQDLLARAIVLVDLRNQHRPTVRLAPSDPDPSEAVTEVSAGVSNP